MTVCAIFCCFRGRAPAGFGRLSQHAGRSAYWPTSRSTMSSERHHATEGHVKVTHVFANVCARPIIWRYNSRKQEGSSVHVLSVSRGGQVFWESPSSCWRLVAGRTIHFLFCALGHTSRRKKYEQPLGSLTDVARRTFYRIDPCWLRC